MVLTPRVGSFIHQTGTETQEAVGAAVTASTVPRDQIFVTTKVPCCTGSHAARCSQRGYGNLTTAEAVDRDLRELGLPQADLILVHWPCDDDADTVQIYLDLEQALAAGKTRAIGVSNFKVSHYQALEKGGATVKPAVNQCEMSVGAHDDATIAYSLANNITYESYAPLGGTSGVDVLSDPDVKVCYLTAVHCCLFVALPPSSSTAVARCRSGAQLPHCTLLLARASALDSPLDSYAIAVPAVLVVTLTAWMSSSSSTMNTDGGGDDDDGGNDQRPENRSGAQQERGAGGPPMGPAAPGHLRDGRHQRGVPLGRFGRVRLPIDRRRNDYTQRQVTAERSVCVCMCVFVLVAKTTHYLTTYHGRLPLHSFSIRKL